MEEGINARRLDKAASQSELRPDASASGDDNDRLWRLHSLPKASGFFSRNVQEAKGKLSTSGLANWARNLRVNTNPEVDESSPGKSPFSLFSTSFGRRSPVQIPVVDAPLNTSLDPSPAEGSGHVNNITKGFFDSSRNAMKAVQNKARHLVSQNKRRFQEDGFDLDMTYITDNIIAMGFPSGDMSSGFLGFVEGFYRNHMEEVIRFFESRHKGKYKVYNLCSERLYDASLLEGKVACFPFDDNNCPPLHLVEALCRSSYSWLKGDLDNVVVIHCKAGMARTGLMISSLLLHLKFFPTAEESISYYNQKRCVDSKGLVLPSQLRYVKYYERVLRNCNGETPRGRKVVLRGFRLHRCPFWIRPSITVWNHDGLIFSSKKHPRTKDTLPEESWFNAPRKGIIVFALPGERGLADLEGDFKVHFHDRHGDFYCWLNTTMMENRTFLNGDDLDGFDKRKLPSPGFQVEIVVMDVEAFDASTERSEIPSEESSQMTESASVTPPTNTCTPDAQERDDIFSDSESEGGRKAKPTLETKPEVSVRHDNDENEGGVGHASMNDTATTTSIEKPSGGEAGGEGSNSDSKERLSNASSSSLERSHGRENESVVLKKSDTPTEMPTATVPASDFKAIAAANAADASVFTFGDDEDYESD